MVGKRVSKTRVLFYKSDCSRENVLASEYILTLIFQGQCSLSRVVFAPVSKKPLSEAFGSGVGIIGVRSVSAKASENRTTV